MCGRLCPQESLCEGACVVGFAIRPDGSKQPPVAIGRLESFITDSQRKELKGFTNPNRVEFAVVNLDALAERFQAGEDVTPIALLERGMVRKGRPVKVLGRGQVDRALTVHAHAVSATAREKIERAGGTVVIDSL